MRYATLLVVLLLMLPAAYAVETLKVGGYKIQYDQVLKGDSDFDGINDRTSYYLDDELVFAAFDTDGDGKADMWFRYPDGMHKDLAMRDTNGNGRPENILEYDEAGDITSEVEKGFRMPDLSGLLNVKGALYGVIILAVLIFAVTRLRKKSKPAKKKSKKLKKKKKN